MTERLWRGIIWPKPEYTDPEVLWEILTVPCGDCGGTGLMVTPVPFPEHKSCPSCGGKGRTLREGVEQGWWCVDHGSRMATATHCERILFMRNTATSACRRERVYVVPASMVEEADRG